MPELPPPDPSRVPVPDLLNLQPHLWLDDVAVDELMEISFLGGGAADRLEEARKIGAPRLNELQELDELVSLVENRHQRSSKAR